jgi:hypothetical protein
MQRPEDAVLTRERPFQAKRTCLLLIDTQNYVWNPEVAQRASPISIARCATWCYPICAD